MSVYDHLSMNFLMDQTKNLDKKEFELYGTAYTVHKTKGSVSKE